ncbi:hypothetical protein BCR33DRAFT_835454 [Rhizoclosmatium globosum]|uniref:Uncharacterized protein n=1 Tax=Rhizoclosmatium globosum TaxID=329046 RepID=A0A1Y2BNW6_9FUNG|nr:hypothetical protein BCR33DRAFT_835454 [Rhizoclosmatium globosum]|eukprot:ORY36436.1 hypothetical protein BCR33DRAFT_835454 [Rhizoclosmatium globosum]
MDYSKGYLSDQDIRYYLIGLVRSGTISPNVNAYFPIHFQPGIRALTNDNNVVQLSCQDFCGYHSAIDLSHPANDAGIDFNSKKQTQFLYYGVLPDITNPNCHCRDLLNRGVVADTLAVAAHELAEAVTDSVPNMLAWHDFTKNVDGEEVADLCSWQMDKTVSRYDGLSYDVHLLWSNNDVNCVATGSTALAYPAITTGCYQAYDKSRPYAVGSVASALSNGVFHNFQLDSSGNWNQGGVCDPILALACYPHFQCNDIPLVNGAQGWCGSLNYYIQDNHSVEYSPSCSIVPGFGSVLSIDILPNAKSAGIVTYVGVGMDGQLYKRYGISGGWSLYPNSGTVVDITFMNNGLALGTAPDGLDVRLDASAKQWFISPGKAIDVILLPTGAFLQVGIDNYLYSCGSLPNCAKVPGSGSVKSIDLLSDQSTIVGVRMEGKLYTRNGVYGTWSLVQNSGTVVDITVMANGVLVGTGPDGYLYTRQTLTSVGLEASTSVPASPLVSTVEGPARESVGSASDAG